MNYVDIELDAYEIAEQVFKENSDLNKNFCFENVDTKTFFEMLLIITIEGLKKFYGDENNKVDITLLTKNDVDRLNKYLNKINVKLNFKIYDIVTYTVLVNNKELNNFKDMTITSNTNLKEINYIIKKSDLNIIYAISYDFIR
jgi:hypothetical protein|tara:strand:- start:151 stop:579 length:429 start_codon:yes stop_codon:yes gene_type:complete